MANLQRNFIAGIMNKSLDERLLPNGQYVDALNVRLGSTEETEVGSVENTKGNVALTTLEYDGIALSSSARCIGAFEDGGNETIYWFIHDGDYPSSPTNTIDLIVSYNVQTQVITYHVISISDDTGSGTKLNFNPSYLITGISLVDSKLLFFTDNINPPRFINVQRNYPNPVANIDGFDAESLLVIKKPPRTSPSLQFISAASQNNFLEDRFVCFAYRYQYADGEFSATSQFSEPAFIPSPFSYDFGVGLNEGMLNAINVANIRYDSGGPLVVAIELLWKDMNNGSIRVIEKLDKSLLNITDNTEYTYEFSDSKIFTVLPSSEILRLYDNVPRLAQAQTLMGNRLIYGNYLEQYDLLTAAGAPVQLNYTTDLISEDIGVEDVEEQTATTSYTFGPTSSTVQNGAIIFLDIDSLDIQAGSIFDFEINFEHQGWTGPNPPAADTPLVAINFTFICPRDYGSAFDMASSQEFLDQMGTIANIQLVPDACDGVTTTDKFNCVIPNTLGALTKYESGVSGANQPMTVIASAGNPNIGFTLLRMRFVDDPTGVAITQEAYEDYQVASASCTFQTIGDPKSLKSNRSYEVGIIYMDEFNRASTALVSQNNTVHVPCSESDSKNSIQVTIPTTQIAPDWATRYKLCIKQDKENYFNIYSSFFFTDPVSSATYFLLEGQNAQKVEEGDILQVKADSTGPLERCAFATVLEKKSQVANFLGEDNPPIIPGTSDAIPIPTGVYMKMRPNEFSATFEENSVINFGERSSKGSGCRTINYPVHISTTVAPLYENYDIPAGSKIRIRIDNYRQGKAGVPERKYLVDENFTANQDYPNFKDWFDGQQIASSLSAQGSDSGTGVSGIGYNSAMNSIASCNCCAISCSFYDTIAPAGSLWLKVKSSEGYSGNKKNVRLRVLIEVIRATSFIAWETKPTDAVPDLWYLSSDSYPLAKANSCEFEATVSSSQSTPIQFDYVDVNGNPANIVVAPGETTIVIGECTTMVVSPSTPPDNPSFTTIDSYPLPQGAHIGNVQNQFGGAGGTNTGIINTAFFNCYSFGNGIESYLIRDEIAGQSLTLGNQVTSTSAQEYKEVLRFADLTYSGVFNDESNVNKLNEFNLGLLNFKALEEEFGLVMKLDGRETDILCLQEDKISYILSGKNLLSDAVGGGAVTSVPEVLGTQIARIEEYGISFNPESFAKWGSNKFFTDAKRGAVLQLKGTSAQNEQLAVISEAGMRSWFRDLFIDNFTTQKLGGYDPYMNEYVLSSNEIDIPQVVDCIECGVTRTLNISDVAPSNFCVDVGSSVGQVDVNWTVLGGSGDDFKVEVAYNNVVDSSGNTAVSGTLPVNKNSVTPETLGVFIEMVGGGDVVLEVTVLCPNADSISIIQVCVSRDQNAGELIHNEYDWNDGVVQSPTTSVGVQLASGTTNPLISQYSVVTGLQGSIAPSNGATVTIQSNRIAPNDDYIFDPTVDNLRYLRTSTLYVNTPGNIANLLAASNNATPILGGGNTYRANFVMPNTTDEYLYLIYDYRAAEEVQLCYDANTSFAACCECGAFSENYIAKQCRQDAVNVQYSVALAFGLTTGDFCELQGFGDCVFEILGVTSDPTNAVISAARPLVTDCDDLCYKYRIDNFLANAATINFIDCNDDPQSVTLQPGRNTTLCLKDITSLSGNLTINLDECGCSGGDLQFYEVTQCRQDGVVNTEIIQDFSNSLNIGDYVEISNYVSCTFEVTQLSAGPATETVLQQLFIRGCSSVCQYYLLENASPGPTAVDYVDCSNGAQVITIAGGGSNFVCASQFVSLSPFITVTLSNCGCP